MRIRKLRVERGLTIVDLIKRTGIHAAHIKNIESGKHSANARTLRAIAKALDVTPADLLNHDVDDDIGYLVELMRKWPDCAKDILRRVKPLVVN
jgi:transcriptional regulator with XRE-family HTH domain